MKFSLVSMTFLYVRKTCGTFINTSTLDSQISIKDYFEVKKIVKIFCFVLFGFSSNYLYFSKETIVYRIYIDIYIYCEEYSKKLF